MNKQFCCLVKRFIISRVILFSSHQFFAQAQGAWVVKQMPDVLPTNWSRAVGENCVIYVGQNDSIIYAYDLSSGQWHEYDQPTTTPWKDAARAGKNAAIVCTDSILTAYSVITQSFHTLHYEGTLLGQGGLSDFIS